MPGICHRCHAVLPDEGAGVKRGGDEERALYCRECGAPQIMLPEYLRADPDGTDGTTTGAMPPPRPQIVDWQAAVLCAVPVTVVTGTLTVLARVVPQTGFLATVCVLLGAGVVLGLYRARRPLARIDGRVGVRVGLLTGLLMVAAMGVGVAASGVISRYALHRMANFDSDLAKSQAEGLAQSDQMLAGMVDEASSKAIRQQQMTWMATPEFRAGSVLSGFAITAGFVLLLTSLGGGFAGLLQGRRRALQSRE